MLYLPRMYFNTLLLYFQGYDIVERISNTPTANDKPLDDVVIVRSYADDNVTPYTVEENDASA